LNPSKHNPLIVILGPTAVGKTEISLELAIRLNGEIVSADSRLLYRGMDLGTAKPSLAERQRVPHHLIDVTDPDQTWSLALYQKEARKAISSIHDRERLPFLVGGTGQYIKAIIEEWEIPKVAPASGLRKALEKWSLEIGKEGLHKRLASLDPRAAANIDHRNLRRTIRALEVILLTGRAFSHQRLRGDSPYHTLQIGLNRPREELYERIDQRIDVMLQAGFVDEVRQLLAQGYSPDLPNLSAIGYREIIAYLHGQANLEEAVTHIKRATRVFVRRQANWFKYQDPEIHWFEAGTKPVEQIEGLIHKWLGS
jgi:tRNA dimethylallyltransferase